MKFWNKIGTNVKIIAKKPRFHAGFHKDLIKY